MKLTIFGASSETGKLLVNKALAAGYDVTAFVRDPSRLGVTHQRLKVITGDALNPAHVEEAVRGSDAVLSTLGPKGKPAIMAAKSTKNIIDAMQKHGVKRLVVISVAGVPVSQDHRGFNLVNALIKLLLRRVFVDRENQLSVLQHSQLEWVALRVPRLTDEAPTRSVQTFFGNPSPRMRIGRADVADFMLNQIKESKWLRQAPIISNEA